MSGNVDALPAARDSGVIQDLLKRKSDIDQQYADAMNQYGPNYPESSTACRTAKRSE